MSTPPTKRFKQDKDAESEVALQQIDPTVIAAERLLPNAEMYERSFMHRDVVTHVVSSTTDFIITASRDGFVKFWKKQSIGIEFVKHIRAHVGMITSLSITANGQLLATASPVDNTIKLFDVVNFGLQIYCLFSFL